MWELDLHQLAEQLLQTSPAYQHRAQMDNPYLWDHVIYPVTHGLSVTYGDLDFDRFDNQDIEDAKVRCELLSNTARQLFLLYKEMKELPAQSSIRKQHC